MFQRFERSWELTKQCWSLLSRNKVLILFPILSGMASLMIVISFMLPLFMGGAAQLQHHRHATTPQDYLMMFALYFCLYFVQTFFSCALMASANMAFAGGDASLGVGLSLAWSRFGRILVWSVVAATVGMILRTIQERVGLLGRILVALMGAAWTVLTYFMGPIIVFEDLGVSDGIARSTAMIKKTWGEGMSKGIAFSALSVVAIIALVVGFLVMVSVSPLIAVLYFLVGVVTLATVTSAMDGIFKVALYRYACWNMVPEGFSPVLVEAAFKPKK
jgi:hypothetical protein